MEKYAYFPLICLSGLVARAIVCGASVGDALAMFALGGLFAFQQHLKSKEQKPLDQEVRAELELMKSTLNALKVARSMGRLP